MMHNEKCPERIVCAESMTDFKVILIFNSKGALSANTGHELIYSVVKLQ